MNAGVMALMLAIAIGGGFGARRSDTPELAKLSGIVVRHYILGDGQSAKNDGCSIRFNGRPVACRMDGTLDPGETMGAKGVFGWPHESIIGLNCSELLCLAADARKIDLYHWSLKSKSPAPMRIHRMIVVRRDGDVIAVALSSKRSQDRAWLGLVDSGSGAAEQVAARQLLDDYFKSGVR